MYIERLHVRNVRLLAEQELSFVNAGGSPRMWTVIVGENGVCKSTILQAIALAAMGPKLGSALVQDAQRLRNLNSRGAAASITANFWSPSLKSPSITSSLRIDPDRYDLIPGKDSRGARFLDNSRARRRSDFFVAGYGVGRFLAEPGETVLPKDPIVQRVKGLFNPRHTMLGLNFSNAFRERDLAYRFSKILHGVLAAGDSPGERLLPGFCDLDLEPRTDLSESPMFEANLLDLRVGDRTLRLPANWLSDGYQATLSWIADLLGYALLENPGADPLELEGIVLLDEIDLHLHPTWQRRIVPILRKVFPRLQFIVNTHSPLVLAGFEREEIILLKLQDGQVVQDPAPIEPGVLTASEILSNFFDVYRAGRPDLVQKERRYLELQAKTNLASKERAELRDLKRDLDRYIVPSTSAETGMLSPEEILNRKA